MAIFEGIGCHDHFLGVGMGFDSKMKERKLKTKTCLHFSTILEHTRKVNLEDSNNHDEIYILLLSLWSYISFKGLQVW